MLRDNYDGYDGPEVESKRYKSTTSPSIGRESEISLELDDLKSVITSLSIHLEATFSKLVPVTLPPMPIDCNEPKRIPPSTTLAINIREQTERLRGIVGDVNNINDRIAL